MGRFRCNCKYIVLFLYTYFGVLVGLIKVTLLFYNRKKFGNMIKILHNKPFVPDINRGGEVEKIYLRKIVKTTETQMIAYSTLLVTALWSGAVSFLNSRIFNEKSEWRYPFVPIMIIDTTNSPYFELAGIYQTFWISFYGLLIVTADIVLTIILAHLSTQFKILNNAFKSIRMRSRKMNELAGGDSRNEGIILSKILGEYIEHHLRVFELAAQMEELCHLMILAELSGSVLTLCFILYQVSSIPPNSFSFLLYFFYYWIVVFQISLYCYWGNEVTLQAANVAKAVAEADWLEAPKSVRKAIILVTARSQKPLYMTAGKFVNLSIDTLVRIIKGSFSYFMVLRQRGISEG
uniref:Odorant receptor n=1 Tax=Protaetia brevitarsis TaxID=348688 RepID=A0A411HR37_PROBE|nr:odorant receptor [Protaetia brevitarsis]